MELDDSFGLETRVGSLFFFQNVRKGPGFHTFSYSLGTEESLLEVNQLERKADH